MVTVMMILKMLSQLPMLMISFFVFVVLYFVVILPKCIFNIIYCNSPSPMSLNSFI